MKRQTFYHWAKDRHINDDTPQGDFVKDMVLDKEFPWFHSLQPRELIKYGLKVNNYLISKHACDGAVDAFKELFGTYIIDYCGERFELMEFKKAERGIKHERQG